MILPDSKTVFGILVIVLTVAIFLFDLVMPLGVAVGLLYVAVILSNLWSPWREHMYLLASLTTFLTVIAYFQSDELSVQWIVITNRIMSITAIWITATLVSLIQKTEAFERSINETAVDGIISINAEGLVRSFNPAAEKIFSYAASDVLGKNVSMLMPSPYREKHEQYLNNFLATGKKKTIGDVREVEGMRRDGTVFPMTIAVNESYKSKTRHFVGIVRDISSQKLAEEELRREHELNEKLIDTARSIILILNMDGSTRYFNNYMEELCGYQLEEVMGKDWVQTFVADNEQERIKQEIKSRTAGTRENRLINTIFTKTGHSRLIEWYDTVLTNASGEPDAIFAIGHDITERQLTHDRLIARSKQLISLSELEQMLLSGVELSMFFGTTVKSIVDTLGLAYGYILELAADDKCNKLISYTALSDSLLDSSIISPEHDILTKLTLATDNPVYINDIQADPRFITERHLHSEQETMSGTGIKIASPEKVHGVVCLYSKTQHHLTENEMSFLLAATGMLALAYERNQNESRIQQFQQELIKSSRRSAIGELGTTIVHEINQPITAFINYIHICRRLLEKTHEKLPDPLRTAMDKAVNESERAASIIQHLRDYLQSGSLHQQNADINALIHQTYELFRNEVIEKNIKVSLDLQPDLNPAYVDKIQIQQVVFNLIRNSMDALAQVVSPEIHFVTIKGDENMLEVVVEDSGPGVDPAILELNLETPYSSSSDGLGIGLSICKTIIDAHGGKLWCSSSPLGGASFHFTLPVQP